MERELPGPGVEKDGSGRPRIFRRGRWTVGLLVWPLLLVGCATSPPAITTAHPPCPPDNVYRAAPWLADDIKRVAVLPLACAAPRADLEAGCDALTAVLTETLIQSKRFEVVEVPPGEIRRLTGRTEWTGEEVLPSDFFDLLRSEYGCDAVLFDELTAFRAYPPLAVGWRLKLVDVRRREILWAGDEVFDARQPAVAAAARRFQPHSLWMTAADRETADWLAAHSPSQFGAYSLATLLDTLPVR